ncbi:MAG TPA: hypothetical protein VGW57_12705 [Chthoniobacterales bacterium]|nr:hypothetical protein [Chthoniobacterales bacterium]
MSDLSAADFTVTNNNNSGPGSLYQAITDANATPGADRILFNIPGAGVQKIDVSQKLLPTLTESLLIDGYSQPGTKPNSLAAGDNAVILIQIDGGAGSAGDNNNGLVLSGASSDYLVRGLCLTGFGKRFRATGVAITADAVHSAVVGGNFIGVLADGETAAGNLIGVGHVTQLGGTDPASRNVISGNTVGFAGDAAPASGANIYGAVVQGNYIGTNASGTKAVPNQEGIGLESLLVATRSPCNGTEGTDIDLSKTVIGGTAPGAPNLISGNDTAISLGRGDLCQAKPVVAFDVRVNGLKIQGNSIGVQSDGAAALGNQTAILIAAGADNAIGGLEDRAGNIIAFNGVGIIVAKAKTNTHNKILSNALYANHLSIDLGGDGATPNDPGDGDDGPNNYQNYPVIQSAQVANGSVTITGTLNSTASSQFTLQYFAESLAKQTYLGATTVTTDANGNAQFSASFPNSDPNASFNMTATSQAGDTSEFAQNPARLKNISTRARVEGGDHAAIAGFIIASDRLGSGLGHTVVVRALGPSLTVLATPLPDPILEFYGPRGLQGTNDNWQDNPEAASIQNVGLAPKSGLESALIESVDGGSYTAIVRDTGGRTGTALVEVYDVDPAPGREVLNVSTRGFIGTGDDVMIAGTILEPGAGPTRIVARAIGPSLGAAGITDPLADPMLEFRDSQGALIASNDNWRDGDAAALTALGLAPKNDNESAVFVRVPSAAYTATIRGKDGGRGVGLVELYNLH